MGPSSSSGTLTESFFKEDYTEVDTYGSAYVMNSFQMAAGK